MGLGIKEFEERVLEICDRWYLKGGPIMIISGDDIRNISRPVQVWEKPYSKGKGFETDTLVMEINGAITMLHLKKLKQGHWYRVQAMQNDIFKKCRDDYEESKKAESRKMSYENKEYAKEQRQLFRKMSWEHGFSKLSAFNRNHQTTVKSVTNVGI